jgi:[methyl-Co(III) methanol-specific corrinoid protein]:coenzyme M methyltransferase
MMGNRMALVGSINNPVTLSARGPAEVRKEVYLNLAAGVELIGPECAIPLQTSLENLKEIPRAVEDWYRERGIALPA